MASNSSLFKPFACKSLKIPNRLVMAPMTRSFSPDGIPGDDVAQYYRRRAEGGIGLLITEGTGINRPGSTNHPAIPLFHGEKPLAGWKHVVDSVHAAGGHIAPQLWHVGANAGKVNFPGPDHLESPSGLFKADTENSRPMTDKDIADTIAAFAQGAADAKRLGFDCIQLHGAHGYLIDQFFWSATNRRTDGWGGDLKARTRFAVEIIRAVRKAVGEDMALIMRLSQWKLQDYTAKIAQTPAELEAWLTPLVDAGIDILDFSTRRFWEPEFDGSDMNVAGWAKKITGKPTITVGSVGLSGAEFVTSLGGAETAPASLEGLLERLDRGEFDLVAVGRVLLSDPLWASKVREDRMADCVGFNVADTARLY